jgi:HSP20 family protein
MRATIMTNISLFDPMTQQINRLFHNLVPREWPFEKPFGGDMKIDLSEDKNHYIVRADLPGAKKDDIQVEIDGNRVTISAHTESVKEEKKGETVIHTERYEGRIYRSFSLETGVDQAHAEATYRDGVLELKLPKKNDTGSSKLIKIN